jgi:hypothetical protein
MSLSIYGNLSIPYSVNAMSLAFSAQSHELLNDSTIDYSVRGNRLHKHRDGSLEVIPKTPFEIFGERIIRPLIDTTYDFSSRTFQVLKRGVSFWDNIFSRALNFLPVAKASQSSDDQSTLSKCVSLPLNEVIRVTDVSLTSNNPKLLELAHQVYGPFFEKCFNEESYHRAQEQYNKNQKEHNKQVEKFTKKLRECNDIYGTNNCYAYNKIDHQPELFQIHTLRLEKGKVVPSLEWVTSQGYFSWSIYASRFYFTSAFFGSDSYNFDTRTNKPTTRDPHDQEDINHNFYPE